MEGVVSAAGEQVQEPTEDSRLGQSLLPLIKCPIPLLSFSLPPPTHLSQIFLFFLKENKSRIFVLAPSSFSADFLRGANQANLKLRKRQLITKQITEISQATKEAESLILYSCNIIGEIDVMCTIKMEESKLWPQVEQVLGKVRNMDHVLVPQDIWLMRV